jgi:hypothetical protein
VNEGSITRLEGRIQQLEEQRARELKREVERLDKKIDSNRRDEDKGSRIQAYGTVASVVIAFLAVGISTFVYYQTNELQATIAAGEALQRHFEYAAARGVYLEQEPAAQERNAHSAAEHTSAAIHGLYTSNVIYDLTDNTDEKRAWRSTARDLLRQYEEKLKKRGGDNDSLCQEVDKQFLRLARKELGNDWCSHVTTSQPRWSPIFPMYSVLHVLHKLPGR